MRRLTILIGVAVGTALAAPAYADEAGAPAAPSGSPKAAAESGSSEAGKAGATNEMSSHKENADKQGTMADPHKQSK